MNTKHKNVPRPVLIFPTILLFFKTVVAPFHNAGAFNGNDLQKMALLDLEHISGFLSSGIAQKISIAMQKEKRGRRKKARKHIPFRVSKFFLFVYPFFSQCMHFYSIRSLTPRSQ